MSYFKIDIKVSRIKTGHDVRIVCPYGCRKIFLSYDGFRKHLTRNHSNELGITEVKRQASKLYRMYREARV